MKKNYFYILLLCLMFVSGGLFAQESTATYRVTFDAQWSRTTHPYQFPFDARWSPPVGFTHDASATPLFEEGTIASQGVVNVSQSGSRDPINDEIDAVIGQGVEFRVNSPIRVRPSPDTISFTFDISESHPYLSLISMIAPSPDWFVGFNGLNLFENGEWTESTRVRFNPYDSGSDSGVTFASPNQNTSPREGISKITDGPIFGAGEASLGTWIIERIDNGSNCEVAGGSLEGGPFRFCVGDGTADNIGASEISISGVSGTNSQWVVTDENGYIQGLPGSFTGPNFDVQGTGVCFVSHLSYEDGLEGLEPGANIADLVGCFNFSNSTYVDRQEDDETCAPNETASYRIIFDAAWSAATHPTDFPADEPNIARWSPPVGMTHNADTRLFLDGAQASQGIVNVSQTGSRDPINDEIDQFIVDGGAQYRVNSLTRVRPSPDTISFTFDISSSHPRISLVSMIAPSPDWFVALRDLKLFNNGEWTESQLVKFKPYDSGSDGGTTFQSPNFDTQPRVGITPLTDGPIFANGNDASLGLWRIERTDDASTCDVFGGSLTGGPFTFCVDGTADNIPAGAISVANATGTNSQWVVTDANGNILGLPASFTGPDFDAAGLGLCFVHHLSYEDGLVGLEMGGNIENFEGCFNLSNGIYVNRIDCASEQIVGAVYAMTNGEGQVEGNVQGPNSIVAFGQAADGTLSQIGSYSTGGNGGDFDGGEGLDPLISAYAVTKTLDNRFVLAVNAGSNTVTSMKVNPDFSLSVVDTEGTEAIGPNSIAIAPSSEAGVNGLVYVSNITRPEFLALGEPAQQGTVIGYRLMDDGSLEPVEGSQRDLANRPSAVQFSPNGDFLVVASINAGAAALASGSEDEIVVYAVNADGTLSAAQTDGATSTLRGNTENRNLPSAIGFQIVGDNYVVVTEAREFQADGTPPAFPALQDGSVSTWQIQADGTLTPISLDVASGENNTGRTACWLDFSDENTFFVSNAIEAGLASYSFDNGVVELVNQVAAQGTGATGNTTDPAAAFGTTEGWIDMWISDDGKFLYQAYGLEGTVGVFAIDGTELTFIQEIAGDLPSNNIQGLVSVGQPANDLADDAGEIVGAVFAMSNGRGQIDGNVQGPNTVVAYGQAENGMLTLLGEYPTGGNGGDYDGGEGLDPLISAYAITKTVDNRFVLAVNAGSNTVSSMRVNEDFSLTVVDVASTEDIGPNSIAHAPSNEPGVNGLVYVSNITRPEFLSLGEPSQQGSVIGYRLMDDGSLEPVAGSQRDLLNRPSAVQFSPNGDFLVVASINAGAAALASGSEDEIVVYAVNADGTLSATQTDGATSTLRGNAENRNLPSAIGFQIVGDNYVVVTEAREFQADGTPPAFPALQDGSVSTWQIQSDGTLTPITLDVASGENNTGRTACWLDFSDENTFFVSNAIEAGLASYSFDNGVVELINQVAAQGTGATGNTTDPAAAFGTTEGWIDMWISDDGQYLYQCYGLEGTVGVFAIDGSELTFIQEVTGDLPQNNVQGIVSVGMPQTPIVPSGPAVGAVFAMTNGEGQIDGNVQGPNSVVAYAQAADGTLTLMGTYPTGGNGGDYDGGEGLDPLISAYAITKSVDNRFVMAVNAGSNTVTSMRVNEDFSLTVIDTESTEDIGPNSIAHAPSNEPGVNGLVYVSNITRPEFLSLGEPSQQGSVIGYRLMDDGSLEPVAGSQRDLLNRPSAVQFSPNGDFLVVASINAGAAALASGSEDEIVVYAVNADGTLSATQTDGATSTLRGNAENRNLPSAIGFQIVGDNYVVVTEAREFQADGTPPAFPALQDGSVSTWQIQADGTLTPISLDVASGENNTGRTACWLDFSDENTFFVSNAIEAGLASYSFDNGVVELINQVAAQGTGATGNTTDPAAAFGTTEGWIDMWISDDGKYLYQCYGLEGTVGVFAIDGSELTFIQEVTGDLPQNNVQGIVSVGMPSDGGTGTVAGVDLDLNIEVDNRLYNIFEEVAYTITLTNNGDETSTNVIVDASYPEGMVIVSASATNGNFDTFLEELTVASLAPGQTTTLDLVLYTLIENVNITNVVTVVGSGQPDTDFTNNSDFVTIVPFSNGGVATGVGSVDLELEITTASTTASQFENVVYNITLTNNGVDAATNIYVNAGIPQGLAFTSASATNGAYSYFFENWNIDELAAGQSATLTLTLFTLVENSSLTNYVQVFAVDQNDTDSTPGNNPGNAPNEDDEAVSVITTGNSFTTDGIALRSTNSDIQMNNMYPNPTNSSITLNFEAKASYDTELRVMDVTGRVVSSYAAAVNKGNNEIRMDVSYISSGIYFIEVTDQNGEITNHKFIKIN